LYAVDGHDFLRVASNVREIPNQLEDTIRDVGLELSISGEDNIRLNRVRRKKIQKVSNSSHMPLILVNRVLKPVPSPIENLHPIATTGIGKDPSFVVLGLYDEYAKSRYQDVIDLCSTAVEAKRDMV